MEYGQFCPVAKATEVIGEKWTLLLIREILLGGSRFNELQRGLSLMSPTLLSKRLEKLVQQGLVLKRKIPGQKGHEYFPTESCKELRPVINILSDWGMKWTRKNMTDKDYDTQLLMLYISRHILVHNIPGNETTFRFNFWDNQIHSSWWILIKDQQVELCLKDPGKEVDVYFNTSTKVLTKIWMQELQLSKAIREKQIELIGDRYLINHIDSWLKLFPLTNND